MKTTIRDVALKAKVAPSTVSYAFNGKRPISDEVKQRIMEAVKALDYRPSYVAKLMKSSKTMSIGIVANDCVNPVTSQFINSLGKLIRENGYHMILGISGGEKTEGIKIMRHFSSGVVDGIINLLPGMGLKEAAVICRDVPVVTFGRNDAESPTSIDFKSGVIEMLEYLIGLKHKKIGFISIKKRGINIQDPCIYIAKIFFESRGIKLDDDLILEGDGTYESGQILGEKLYQKGATAIFAGNDISGAGTLTWAHENGIKCPEKISIAGCDDTPLASSVYPTLTTIHVDQEDLARYTFWGLKDRMVGKNEWQHKFVSSHLVVRNSCGPCMGNSKKSKIHI